MDECGWTRNAVDDEIARHSPSAAYAHTTMAASDVYGYGDALGDVVKGYMSAFAAKMAEWDTMDAHYEANYNPADPDEEE